MARNHMPEPDALDGKALEREVLLELIRLHSHVLRRMPMIQTLLVAGIGVLVYSSVPWQLFAGWSVLTISAECLRSVYAGKILRQTLISNPRLVSRRLTALAALVGITVGLSAFLFMPVMALADRALLGIILFAMPAAGVSVAVSSKPILAVYSCFILVPAAMAWAMLNPPQYLTVAGLTALYWGFIISVAADGENLLRRSVAIRCERDRVVKDLERSNQIVREAVAAAEQSSQARARVLAAASHDLRQPLHALSIYSAVLVSNPPPETLPEVARNIDRLVRALGGLLHGLLDLSRLSSEHYHPEKQRVSLDRLADEVCNDFQALADDKGLELVRNLQHVRLWDDPVAIARIIRNLLDNAVKYTEQGRVVVYTRCRDGLAELIVEDTGKGIPVEEQNRIFEEFYQLDNPSRDHSRGVGLGLAIVLRLTELIGATVEVESAPGAGTRFRLSFATLAEIADGDRKIFGGAEKPLQSKKVYVVDDEADILVSMHVLLTGWQMQVETALSAHEAEALFLRAGKPDLLIVDLRLQGAESGVALAARLQDGFGGFPVLVVTGETASDALQQIHGRGYPLLHKPIVAEVFRQAICAAL